MWQKAQPCAHCSVNSHLHHSKLKPRLRFNHLTLEFSTDMTDRWFFFLFIKIVSSCFPRWYRTSFRVNFCFGQNFYEVSVGDHHEQIFFKERKAINKPKGQIWIFHSDSHMPYVPFAPLGCLRAQSLLTAVKSKIYLKPCVLALNFMQILHFTPWYSHYC